jgi:hypothetical protein
MAFELIYQPMEVKMASKKTSRNTIVAYDDQKWRVEQDLRYLVEAEKIRKDPKRMKAAQALAAEQADEMNAIKLAIGENKS